MKIAIFGYGIGTGPAGLGVLQTSVTATAIAIPFIEVHANIISLLSKNARHRINPDPFQRYSFQHMIQNMFYQI